MRQEYEEDEKENNSKWGILRAVVNRLLGAPIWFIFIVYPPFLIAWAFFAVMIYKNATGDIDTISRLYAIMFPQDTITERKTLIGEDFEIVYCKRGDGGDCPKPGTPLYEEYKQIYIKENGMDDIIQ